MGVRDGVFAGEYINCQINICVLVSGEYIYCPINIGEWGFGNDYLHENMYLQEKMWVGIRESQGVFAFCRRAFNK